jgi:hypothetical protein
MTKFGVPATAGKLHSECGVVREVEPLTYADWLLIGDGTMKALFFMVRGFSV